MLDFKKRQKVRRRIYSRYTIALLVIILLFLLHGTWGIFKKMQASKVKLEAAVETRQNLESRHSAIETQIRHLDTETGLEEEIRTKYNLAKEGEHVIVLVDTEADNDNAAAAVESGFWSKIFSWFR